MSKRNVNVKRQRVDSRVRSLLDGTRKQAVSFLRNSINNSGNLQYKIWLTTLSTVTTPVPLATADRAVLQGCGSSSAFINYIDLREYYFNSVNSSLIRRIVVCWKKVPVLIGSVGTPPLAPMRSDLLVTDGAIFCQQFLFDSVNPNGYTILDDSVIKVDVDNIEAEEFRHVRIPVNRRMTFMSPTTSTQNGGHLDPSVPAGFVRSNLITVHYWSSTNVTQVVSCVVDYYM